eukprot:2516200-Pyramimonas_sp.AAC.1
MGADPRLRGGACHRPRSQNGRLLSILIASLRPPARSSAPRRPVTQVDGGAGGRAISPAAHRP